MKKLFLLIVICFTLLNSQVFASGNQEGESKNGNEVTLHFLKIDDPLEAQAFAEMVDEFHQIEGGKYSYVNVEFDVKPFAELAPSISKAVATNSNVDIALVDGPNMKHFAYNNVIQDLTPYFTEEELKTWAPQSVTEGSYLGKFYGPPEAQSAQLLWYNKDMFEEAGISTNDTAGWTLGQNGTALTNFKKLTKDKDGNGTPEVFGANTDGPWDYFYGVTARTRGEKDSKTYNMVSDDGLHFVGYFDTPEAIEAYQFAQDLVYKYKIKSSQTFTNQMFTGLAATTFYQDMIMGTQKDMYPDFNMGAMEPTYWTTPICHTGSWHYSILRTSKNFEEALAFVKYCSSDAGAKYIWKYKNQFPANVNLYNSIDEFVDPENPRNLMVKFFEEYGQPRIQTAAYTEFNTLFTEFWTSLMAGEEDVAGLTHDYALKMEDAASMYVE